MKKSIIPVIRKGAFCDLPEPIPSWAIPILDFILQWTGPTDKIELQTSGSTGMPKLIEVDKKAMRNSAQRTNSFFGIQGGEKGLMPLSAKYVGGMMMIVRALEGTYDLDAIEPDSNPLQNLSNPYDLISVVPLQLKSILTSDPEKASTVKHILVGGAPIDAALEEQVSRVGFKNIYQGFGMTETVSHFALRRVGIDQAAQYRVLKGVDFGQDDRACLWVNIDGITDNKLQTNDVIEVTGSDSFRWLGRSDWVINSAGLKIHPEKIETSLSPLIAYPFICLGLEDQRLGQVLHLVLETSELSEKEQEEIWTKIENKLDKHHRPKAIFCLNEFPKTPSGKVDRRQIIGLLKE